jgi:S-adenosylmethionine hydrolase
VTGPAVPAVYFASDYGLADEFVGVVHAVLHRRAPGVPVIDLSHQIAPFDVAAGAALLVRCAADLGAGVVLAVVDPGVGTARRALAVEVGTGGHGPGSSRPDGPEWLVGPDNGLLAPLAAALGGARRVFALDPHGAGGPIGRAGRPRSSGPTFDGRDVFAPAAAHLVVGGEPARIGQAADPASLVPGVDVGSRSPAAPFAPVAGARPGEPAGVLARSSVASVDRFGNVQLGLAGGALDDLGLPPGALAEVTADGGPAGEAGLPRTARRVVAFAELGPGELGLLIDSSGQVALVLDRASAALHLGLAGAGSPVTVSPAPSGSAPPPGDPTT